MALDASFCVLELRSAIRAGADERLGIVVAGVEHGDLLHAAGARANDRFDRTRGTARGLRLRGLREGEQLLLHALLHPHPVFERQADRVRDREDLVRSEANGLVGADTAQLAVDLIERDPRAQRQRDLIDEAASLPL